MKKIVLAFTLCAVAIGATLSNAHAQPHEQQIAQHRQVASVVASVPTTTLTLGETTQATAIAYDAQGNVVDVPINWQQVNKGAVAVNNKTGLVTAIRVGTDGYVVAKVGTLLSNPLRFIVTP